MEGPLDLPAVGSVSSPALHVDSAAELDDLSRFIFHCFFTLDDVSIFKADLPVRGQSEEALYRLLHEVVPLNIYLFSYPYLPASGTFVFGVVFRLKLVNKALGPVFKYDLKRTEHGHPPLRRPVEFLSQAVLKKFDLYHAVCLCNTYFFAETPDRLGRIPPAPEAAYRWHPRVVPA